MELDSKVLGFYGTSYITFLHPFYPSGISIYTAGFITHILIQSSLWIPFISSTNPERIEFDFQINYS